LAIHFSPVLQYFCCLLEGHVPDESVVSKFKIKFENEIHLFFDAIFNNVVDIFTNNDASLQENSPQKGLSGTLIDDTTDLEPKVKENNQKMLQSQVQRMARQ
jgi:hypothetical protein